MTAVQHSKSRRWISASPAALPTVLIFKNSLALTLQPVVNCCLPSEGTMGWGFRRSRSFGLFRFNFSKSGIGVSVGVPGARIGINSKGKKYVRGGIPGTGLYYQQNLPEGQHNQPDAQPTRSTSPLIVILVLAVAGLVIHAMLSSSPATPPPPTSAPPVQQTVAPVAMPASPVRPERPKKHKRKHVAHRATAASGAPGKSTRSPESGSPSIE